MRLALAGAICLAGAVGGGVAHAQCLGPDDLARGVLFERQGDGLGRAIAADGVVRVDYDYGQQGYTDRHDLSQGLYETARLASSAPPDVIGVWSSRETTISWQGRFPPPEPGAGWQSTASTRWEMSDFSGVPQRGRDRFSVTYAFLAQTEARLGGCTYAVIPVEVRWQGRDSDRTHRHAYFPALGLAIETQVTDHLTGQVSTRGITALRAAP